MFKSFRKANKEWIFILSMLPCLIADRDYTYITNYTQLTLHRWNFVFDVTVANNFCTSTIHQSMQKLHSHLAPNTIQLTQLFTPTHIQPNRIHATLTHITVGDLSIHLHHWWDFKWNAFMHCHNAPINAKMALSAPLNHHPTDTTIHTSTHSTHSRKHTTLTHVTVGDLSIHLSPLVRFQRECIYALSQCTNQCKNGIHTFPQPTYNWHNYSQLHTFSSLWNNPILTHISQLVIFLWICHQSWDFKGNAFMHCHNASINA